MKRSASAIDRHLNTISRSFRQIETALLGLAPLLANLNGAPAKTAAAPPRPRKPLSPQRRAALKLQGSYLGYMRQLKPQQKAKVRVVKEKKGIRVAIAEARRMAEAR